MEEKDFIYIPDKNLEYYLLKEFDTEYNCGLYPQDCLGIKSLDLSHRGIRDMRGIEYFKDLEILICDGNEFAELELLNHPNLKQLYCDTGKLEILDVKGCLNLEELGCSFNNLSFLDISKCPKLQDVHCSHNRLTELDATNNRNLTRLVASNNNLSSLKYSGVIDEENVFYHNNPNLNKIKVIFV